MAEQLVARAFQKAFYHPSERTRSMSLLNTSTIERAVEKAVRHIPPAWPLSATVAVNPFLGQTGEPLEKAATRLSRLTGARFLPDRGWFRGKIEAAEIIDSDLEAALRVSGKPFTIGDLKACLDAPATTTPRIPLISDLVSAATNHDWTGILTDRLSNWAGAYFDDGQALWVLPEKASAWKDWRGFASHDLAPEIHGLSGFAAAADGLSPDRAEFLLSACETLQLPASAMEAYFHALLLSLGGWAQLARYRLWQSELKQTEADTAAGDLLAIRLFWEVQLYRQYAPLIQDAWARSRLALAAPIGVSAEMDCDSVLQTAADIASARRLNDKLSEKAAKTASARPQLQAAFCIDVRSEVFRRELERLSPEIETLGFAGFFGLTTSHRRFASDTEEHRLPVLLNPGLSSVSGTVSDHKDDDKRRYRARAVRAWGRFRQAAVSSFAFVEAGGFTFAGKLVGDSAGLNFKKGKPEPQPHLVPDLEPAAQIAAAETILRAMSLTDSFAPIVLLAGHGASVVNNPHQSALQCGACGGYSGEVNARLLASLLNAAHVRSGLEARGITIPDDTVFIGALHDTATDEIKLYTGDCAEAKAHPLLAKVTGWLAAAGRATRSGRAARLPGAKSGSQLHRRSRDWSETRPEWGLAGCKAFIAAPRGITRGRDLSSEAFLHNYSWEQDEGFRVLELILTAPVVVASWISLQYYGSAVAPDIFGAGNKVLHNVVGGFGVLEGNGGVLRTGLPIQSVHDGEKLAHDPIRLTVCVAAPKAAISNILARHSNVRDLFENGWLHLYTVDDAGSLGERYCGELNWEPAPWRERADRAAAA
jgi:uncharacterized protein